MPEEKVTKRNNPDVSEWGFSQAIPVLPKPAADAGPRQPDCTCGSHKLAPLYHRPDCPTATNSITCRERLKKLSFLITGNDYAFFSANPQIEEALKVYVEALIREAWSERERGLEDALRQMLSYVERRGDAAKLLAVGKASRLLGGELK